MKTCNEWKYMKSQTVRLQSTIERQRYYNRSESLFMNSNMMRRCRVSENIAYVRKCGANYQKLSPSYDSLW